MPWTRASELERTLECQAGLLLPKSSVKSLNAQSSAAWGQIAHHWAATGDVLTLPGYENLTALFEKRRANWPDRASLWPSTGRHEVALGYDCLTGETAEFESLSLEKRNAWKESLPESWISGSLDYTANLFGIPWVDDLKTGVYCPDPGTHPQFLLYGLVMYLREYPRPDHLLVSVTHWPRYPIDRGAKRVYAHVSSEDLDVFQKRLKEAYLRWEYMRDAKDSRQDWTDTPSWNAFQLGTHCQFCPARETCPAI